MLVTEERAITEELAPKIKVSVMVNPNRNPNPAQTNGHNGSKMNLGGQEVMLLMSSSR